MTIPKGAILEDTIALGVVLYDVSHLLPRRKDTLRDPKKIKTVFLHHSGALGSPGFKGAKGSARYVVTQREPPFPGPAYTFWIPFEEERDEKGNLVIYRLNHDNIRSWHTGGKANDTGVSVCLQGNTSTRPLSYSHVECLEALLPWVWERYELDYPDALSWHSEATRRGAPRNKKKCPGAHAEKWIEKYRSSIV